MRWAGNVARMVEKRNTYRVLVENPIGKRPLGRPRRKWKDNIKTDAREMGWGCMYWIPLDQDRDHWRAVVNMVMNLLVPQNIRKFLSSWGADGFSRRTRLHGDFYPAPFPVSHKHILLSHMISYDNFQRYFPISLSVFQVYQNSESISYVSNWAICTAHRSLLHFFILITRDGL
jgi:hypothetical protein